MSKKADDDMKFESFTQFKEYTQKMRARGQIIKLVD